MFLGTGSDVGKSIITTAFCRIFLQDGYSPAPFKAQNMSNNAYVTKEGLELSRAQFVQAQAAGIDCCAEMNPILLKPSSDKVCDVIVLGKSIGMQDAYSYFKNEGRAEIKAAVYKAFAALEEKYNPIVLEGAGSISEINLRETDIVNMSMAIQANASAILIADIERGGVFASLYGSVMLLTEEERKHLKGIIINKFRGDLALFQSGISMIEELCNIPVLGVIPYFEDIEIEDEDSLQLNKKSHTATNDPTKINVAVVMTKHIANFTDYDLLAKAQNVHLYFSSKKSEIEKADIVILPNSQNPIETLRQLQEEDIFKTLQSISHKKRTLMGFGSGYYLMGKAITDTQGETYPALDLLPIETELLATTNNRQIKTEFLPTHHIVHGYLSETGKVSFLGDHPPLTQVESYTEGYYKNANCFGSALNGLLSNPSIVEFILSPYTKTRDKTLDNDAYSDTDREYDKLAAHVRKYVDMEAIYKIMGREHNA